MYAYVTDNNLISRQNYMYSQYKGKSFFKEYLYTREKFVADCPEGISDATCEYGTVEQELIDLRRRAECEDFSGGLKERIDGFVKSFEVRKRLYREYIEGSFKPVDEGAYDNYIAYILLAQLLIVSYRKTGNLKYFSCLLKLDDTLISLQKFFTGKEYYEVCKIISAELSVCRELFEALELGDQ